MGLCSCCLLEIERPPPQSCETCGSPLGLSSPLDGYRCGRCRRRAPLWQRLHWGWLYAPPLDAVLRAAKFGRLEFLAEDLGAALCRRLSPQLLPVDLIVPIPLPPLRRLQRGFNQAAVLARPVADTLGRPVAAALRVTGHPAPQARLRRRARAERHRFQWRGESLEGRRVLLVDDIVTTGATLEDACRALRAARAGRIDALVALRTPEPGEQ